MAAADSIGSLFEGAAAKYLSAVDADPERSNQHEIGGLPSAGFSAYLGTPGKGDGEEVSWPATMAYVTDEDNEPVICQSTATWYDSRRRNPQRSAEYRLYYPANPVTELLTGGDFFLIAKKRDQSLLMVFTPPGTDIEYQLQNLFGVADVSEAFQPSLFGNTSLVLPLRYLLEDLGVESAVPVEPDDELFQVLQARFPGQFPRTDAFSAFARERFRDDGRADPDAALMGWMEMEERMFRVFERQIVAKRLRDGFGSEGDDVDEFISFSLSVQNRRKSRVGRAFENHLHHLFKQHELRFEQGGHHYVTENRSKPDFLFPGFSQYHDQSFPQDNLRLLGAKTSCKERWRQVLAEGERVTRKHLVTMEPGISEQQSAEMRASNLQLVVPEVIQCTYTSGQREWLMSVENFIDEVKSVQ